MLTMRAKQLTIIESRDFTVGHFDARMQANVDSCSGCREYLASDVSQTAVGDGA